MVFCDLSFRHDAILKGSTFHAWKDIRQGEEITHEYRSSSFMSLR